MNGDDEKKIDDAEETPADIVETDQAPSENQPAPEPETTEEAGEQPAVEGPVYELEDEEDYDDESGDEGDGVVELNFAEGIPEEILLSRMESLVFVFPEPITVRRLAKLLSINGKRVRELLGILQEHYRDRGIVLTEVGGGFQFQTNAVNADIVRAAIKVKPLRLSRAALETLAIVAYRQPITRVDVEDVRRVDCGGTLKFLFEKGLVRVLGRKEEPGRPIIYGTSPTFLELFGLKSLNDLPSLHEFSELWDEHQDMIEEQEFPEPKTLTPEEAIKMAAEAADKARQARGQEMVDTTPQVDKLHNHDGSDALSDDEAETDDATETDNDTETDGGDEETEVR